MTLGRVMKQERREGEKERANGGKERRKKEGRRVGER